MTIVHIEHPVRDYDRWKAVFDSDPLGRRAAGVRRYRIVRAADDPGFVMVDLELGSRPEAVQILAALERIWSEVDGVLVDAPRGRIFELVDDRDL